MGDDRSLHSHKKRAITSPMTDCLSRTEFWIKPLARSLSFFAFSWCIPHPLLQACSIRNLVVSPVNDFLLTVTPCVCVSRGWQYHLSGCCSPCPCPAGGHWVIGEDFLISPPWDTHTLVCNTYCRSEWENKSPRQRERFIFCCSEHWKLSNLGCRVLNAERSRSEKLPGTISLCVSARESKAWGM